ncbi:MAG: acyltransferase family protein, partial [Opitutales bacterium]|nr:acyltransferase family protein [Opitutales bacterium]
MHSPNQPSNRIFEYDLIRTVAILAVIMIHCSAEYVIKFPSGSSQFRAGNCLNAASRLAIPCFIMLSGRFLLDENRIEAPIKIAKKFLKLFFILLNLS